MDRFEWLRSQCWLAPWPAAPHSGDESTSPVEWVWHGAASFHVSQHEQYAGVAPQDARGPLAVDAQHLFFKTGPHYPDPTETACRLGIVHSSGSHPRLLLGKTERDTYEIDATQVQQLVLRDEAAAAGHDRPAKQLPAVLTVIFRHVALNLYTPANAVPPNAPPVLPKVADLFAQAMKAGRSLISASVGGGGTQRRVGPHGLVQGWLRSVAELGANAQSASDALADTRIIEGALEAMAAAAAALKQVQAAAGNEVKGHQKGAEVDEEAVRQLLEQRGKQEGTASPVTEDLLRLWEKQKEHYKSRLWLQVLAAGS